MDRTAIKRAEFCARERCFRQAETIAWRNGSVRTSTATRRVRRVMMSWKAAETSSARRRMARSLG